jgi:hypothetical protein
MLLCTGGASMSGVSNTKHLRALIQEVSEAKGLSYQAISDAAERKGHKLGKSVVGLLAKQEYRSTPVTFSQIEGLAAGLGIRRDLVAAAVAADMGVVDASDNPAVRLLVASVDGLSDEDLRVLRQMAERLARPAE